MRVLSLFSGGGLGDYGLTLAGMEIVGQVEIDDYCQKILALRWPEVPKWGDIRTVKGSEIIEKCGPIDLISGGFPCQPFSVAGKQRGKQDDRYLWPEMFRVISEVKPAYILGENVPGIIKFALDTVLIDLESVGYTCQAFTIPACAVDAPHRRDRLWILGYAGSSTRERDAGGLFGEEAKGCSQRKQNGNMPERLSYASEDVAHANKPGSQGRIGQLLSERAREQLARTRSSQPQLRSEYPAKWKPEPNVGRVAHGVANRVDRLKLLGNGQVVQVVQWIGERIMEFDGLPPSPNTIKKEE